MRELETERLYLRKVRETDAQTIFDNWANSEKVTRFLEWFPHKSVKLLKRFYRI